MKQPPALHGRTPHFTLRGGRRGTIYTAQSMSEEDEHAETKEEKRQALLLKVNTTANEIANANVVPAVAKMDFDKILKRTVRRMSAFKTEQNLEQDVAHVAGVVAFEMNKPPSPPVFSKEDSWLQDAARTAVLEEKAARQSRRSKSAKGGGRSRRRPRRRGKVVKRATARRRRTYRRRY